MARSIAGSMLTVILAGPKREIVGQILEAFQ
jgi:hypothetical protein